MHKEHEYPAIKNSKLLNIAMLQGGLFTSKQAEQCGYATQNHSYHINRGHWKRQLRGIYLLHPMIEAQTREYWLWYLWSRDRQDKPQGVFSHDTALTLHELTDVNPEKIVMTVPKLFRKGNNIPKIINLHKENLKENQIQTIYGFKVTTPLATLVMLAEEGKTSDEILEQGVKEAMKKGMIIRDDLKKNPILARFTL
jgi:predicted transcriptional regulator of viral defense system